MDHPGIGRRVANVPDPLVDGRHLARGHDPHLPFGTRARWVALAGSVVFLAEVAYLLLTFAPWVGFGAGGVPQDNDAETYTWISNLLAQRELRGRDRRDLPHPHRPDGDPPDRHGPL